MKRLAQIFLVLSCVWTVSAAQTWKQWSQAWEAYLANPSKANGSELYNLLPAKKDRGQLPDPDSASYFSIYNHLDSLEPLIAKGDRMAVQVAFKLFTICDADFCETLDQILGSLIRKNPRLFLEELDRHKDLVGNLGGLLANLGDEFVDDTPRSNKEIQLRIKSLETVKVARLDPLKLDCVAELKSDLR